MNLWDIRVSFSPMVGIIHALIALVHAIIGVIYRILNMSFESAIMIVLAALAVLLTGLALMIGVAAIWGYREITGEATKLAEKAADKRLKQYFEDDVLKEKILGMVQTAPAPLPTGQQTGTVGEAYPGGEQNNASDTGTSDTH